MYRSLGPRQLSPYLRDIPDAKDKAIQRMLDEIAVLEAQHPNFCLLNDQMASVESAYSLLLDEKEREDKTYRHKIEQQKQSILQCRTNIEGLAISVRNACVSCQSVQRDKERLSQATDAHSHKIDTLERQISTARNTKAQQENILTKFKAQLKIAKEQRIQLEKLCDAHSEQLASLSVQLKNAQNNCEDRARGVQFQRQEYKVLQQEKIVLSQLHRDRQVQRNRLTTEAENLEYQRSQLQSRQRCLTSDLERSQQELQAAKAKLQRKEGESQQLINQLKSVCDTVKQAKFQVRKTHQDISEEIIHQEKYTIRKQQLLQQNCRISIQLQKLIDRLKIQESRQQQLQLILQTFLDQDKKIVHKISERTEPLKHNLDASRLTLEQTAKNIHPWK